MKVAKAKLKVPKASNPVVFNSHGQTLTNLLLLTGRVKADLVLLSLYRFNGSSIAARLLRFF